jgi:hypothetical protein
VAFTGSGVEAGCRTCWPWPGLDEVSRVFVSLIPPPRLPGVKMQAVEYLTQLEHGWD